MSKSTVGSNGLERHDPWVTDSGFKDEFWAIVRDCLTQIYRLSPSDATRGVEGLRARIESPPAGVSGELIYHDEPFSVACDIAGDHDATLKNKKMEEFRETYAIIREHHNR
jgi:hypothetical protein